MTDLDVMMDMLPPVQSTTFAMLVAAAVSTPYAFCCLIYWYHFSARESAPSLRKPNDKPLPQHHDWRSALLRPEGISAPVAYMVFALTLSLVFPDHVGFLVPTSIKTLTLEVKPLAIFAHFLLFDSIMWVIHYTQHSWRWLYYHTHAVHHTIHSPTMVVALTGYLPDTCLLILLPLHLTFLLLGGMSNLLSCVLFAVGALLHLHFIHSEFQHPWDPLMRTVGIANTWDHHVHHLRPNRNLAHFFVFLDKVMGTYVDPLSLPDKLLISK